MNQPTRTIPEELKKRILFMLGMLAVFRMGVAIPSPGVNRDAVLSFFQNSGGGIFGFFNTFTGGAFEQFSVLALGIMPYISASIIFQLLQSSIPALEALKKEGDAGRRKLNRYTRYTTVLIAIVQGFGLAKFFLSRTGANQLPLVSFPYFGVVPFEVMTILTLTAGTCFIMWLGELISEKGVGNGASLIIFAGIIAGFPGGAMQLYEQVSRGEISGAVALALLLFMALLVGVIIFMETAQRRIPVNYSQRMGSKPGGQQGSHLPLKLNFAGVIPPIFAVALLGFPSALTQFVEAPWLQAFAQSFTPQGALYNLIFVFLIVFFCFFYVEIQFNPKEVSDNLKKYGAFVPGIRAGNSTAEYLKYVLDRLTVGGATYLSVVCLIPGFLIDYFSVPFYFGGTALLILVGVALDTSQQIQSHLMTAKYDGMMGGMKVKSRRVRY